MKRVGSHGATGDNFNWVNTIPSYSSIPVEKLFWGDAFTRHRAQRKDIPHSWRKRGNDTSDAVCGPAAGRKVQKHVNPAQSHSRAFGR